ncbi:MAG TPA: efflux RND transporter permease subunit, partial [Candidatus Deferrimicrobium sp.]|nr:efflux RND transporter permease subunit [Candidatus Deferrimicrobium sp.]
TLTPMLCSRFLRPPSAERHGRVYVASERVFNAMLAGYDWSLTRVLRRPRTTILLSIVLFAATAYLFVYIPKGFLPNEDTGLLFTFTEAAQGISFDAMKEHQIAMAGIIGKDPNVESFMSSVGPSGPNVSGNSGRIFIRLKPRADRVLSADEIIQELRPKLAGVPGIRAFLQNLPPIRIGGQLTKSQYQLTLQSPDTGDLYRMAPLLEEKLRNLPGLQDVTSDLQIANPQVNVEIDRDKARSMGVSAEQIEDALFSAYGARQVSTIFAPNNTYKVILELLPKFQRDPTALSRLYVRSSSGMLVPLSAVARLTPGVGPLLVNHLGQLPSVTLSFNLRPGVALGDAVSAVDKVARATLPASITTSFQGTAQAFQASLKGLGILLLMAILVIYIVLGVLYESFIHPLTILSGLPSAGLGALLALLLFRLDLNLYAFVGVIMLIGIVKKNAIMMIDFALEAERKEGKGPTEAILEGCLIRFRPIMMTTMSALMATLPIAIGYGAGGESRSAMGIAVVGGLLFSQLITLYLTPVVYVTLDRLQASVRKITRGGGHR